MADEVKHTPRDYAKELEAGGCKPSHGCNAAEICICDLADDAATEVTTLRALVSELVGALPNARRGLMCGITGISDGVTIHDLRQWAGAIDAALASARAAGFGKEQA